MLSAPPAQPAIFRLPLLTLLIRLATPRRLQVNFHAPPARPGARLGVPTRREGMGDSDRGDTSRSPSPPPSATHTNTEHLPGAGSEAGSAGMGSGVCRTRRKALGEPGGCGSSNHPPAPPPFLLPAPEPRQPRRAREEAARAEGSPEPEADPQAAPAGGCSPGPPRRPSVTYRAEAQRGSPAPPASDSSLASRPCQGRGRYPRGAGAGPRRRDVCGGGPGTRPRPRQLLAPGAGLEAERWGQGAPGS